MRLTRDLAAQAPQCLNPAKDRMISLRGLKLNVIENMGCIDDQYDTIDLCDNEIIKLSDIAPFKKLKVLLLANNRISRISKDAFDLIPNLTSLILTNNKISHLRDLNPIFRAKNLERLSLIENPVRLANNYRKYVIGNLKNLRFLDFERVTKNERLEAEEFCQTEEASELLNNNEVDKSTLKQSEGQQMKNLKNIEYPSIEEIKKIKDAISKAETIEEINDLENIIKKGSLLTPGSLKKD